MSPNNLETPSTIIQVPRNLFSFRRYLFRTSNPLFSIIIFLLPDRYVFSTIFILRPLTTTYSLASFFCFFKKICDTLFSTITASRPLCSPIIGVSDPTRPLRVTRGRYPDEAPSVIAVKDAHKGQNKLTCKERSYILGHTIEHFERTLAQL